MISKTIMPKMSLKLPAKLEHLGMFEGDAETSDDNEDVNMQSASKAVHTKKVAAVVPPTSSWYQQSSRRQVGGGKLPAVMWQSCEVCNGRWSSSSGAFNDNRSKNQTCALVGTAGSQTGEVHVGEVWCGNTCIGTHCSRFLMCSHSSQHSFRMTACFCLVLRLIWYGETCTVNSLFPRSHFGSSYSSSSFPMTSQRWSSPVLLGTEKTAC